MGLLWEPRSLRVTWPDNCRVAVWIVVNIEYFIFGRLGPSLQSHLATGLDIANYDWRRYGDRAGIWRLLDLMDELSIPVTAAINGEICVKQPEVMDAIGRRGWQIIGHGLDNSTPHYEIAPEAELARITRTVELLQGTSGQEVKGWLTPGFSISENTFDLLCKAGLVYTADLVGSDRPGWLDLSSGRLLSIPYSLETNDISHFISQKSTPQQFADAVVDHVEQLAAEPPGAVTGIGLHPFIVGQPGRIKYLRSCLQRLRELSGVWLTTGDQIYEYVRGVS